MTTQQTSAVDPRAQRDDSPAQEPGEERRSAEADDRVESLPREPAPAKAEAVQTGENGNGSRAGSATPYLPDQTGDAVSERWQHIQAEFVDDPRKSVTEAHQLVSELTQRIVDAFAHERDNLEQQWSKGDSVSTEDLRVCLQRYRAFFSRLLPSVHGIEAE